MDGVLLLFLSNILASPMEWVNCMQFLLHLFFSLFVTIFSTRIHPSSIYQRMHAWRPFILDQFLFFGREYCIYLVAAATAAHYPCLLLAFTALDRQTNRQTDRQDIVSDWLSCLDPGRWSMKWAYLCWTCLWRWNLSSGFFFYIRKTLHTSVKKKC